MSHILTLNAGSSSIKFSVYGAGDPPAPVAAGEVENVGSAEVRLTLKHGGATTRTAIGSADHRGAVEAILAALDPVLDGAALAGVGHRIVHGGPRYDAPEILDPDAMAYLETLLPFAPLHQPHNLAAIRAAQAAFPSALQVGCFDTAFHRGQAWVDETFALPRRYFDAGVRRYGFHGLSYDYIAGALDRIDPDPGATRRAIVCHLGNGASMCALRGRRSVASTMGFTALDGLPMGTRCGQIDPGVILYLLAQEGMDVAAITDLLYRQSGLLGLSGLSNDMRALEAAGTQEADEAIGYFTHRIRREIGALTATLGGLDTLVFTGGIGEHSARVRDEVCSGMGWLGLGLDREANARHAAVVSNGTVTVRVIPTDEEIVIARAVDARL